MGEAEQDFEVTNQLIQDISTIIQLVNVDLCSYSNKTKNNTNTNRIRLLDLE